MTIWDEVKPRLRKKMQFLLPQKNSHQKNHSNQIDSGNKIKFRRILGIKSGHLTNSSLSRSFIDSGDEVFSLGKTVKYNFTSISPSVKTEDFGDTSAVPEICQVDDDKCDPSKVVAKSLTPIESQTGSIRGNNIYHTAFASEIHSPNKTNAMRETKIIPVSSQGSDHALKNSRIGDQSPSCSFSHSTRINDICMMTGVHATNRVDLHGQSSLQSNKSLKINSSPAAWTDSTNCCITDLSEYIDEIESPFSEVQLRRKTKESGTKIEFLMTPENRTENSTTFGRICSEKTEECANRTLNGNSVEKAITVQQHTAKIRPCTPQSSSTSFSLAGLCTSLQNESSGQKISSEGHAENKNKSYIPINLKDASYYDELHPISFDCGWLDYDEELTDTNISMMAEDSARKNNSELLKEVKFSKDSLSNTKINLIFSTSSQQFKFTGSNHSDIQLESLHETYLPSNSFSPNDFEESTYQSEQNLGEILPSFYKVSEASGTAKCNIMNDDEFDYQTHGSTDSSVKRCLPEICIYPTDTSDMNIQNILETTNELESLPIPLSSKSTKPKFQKIKLSVPEIKLMIPTYHEKSMQHFEATESKIRELNSTCLNTREFSTVELTPSPRKCPPMASNSSQESDGVDPIQIMHNARNEISLEQNSVCGGMPLILELNLDGVKTTLTSKLDKGVYPKESTFMEAPEIELRPTSEVCPEFYVNSFTLQGGMVGGNMDTSVQGYETLTKYATEIARSHGYPSDISECISELTEINLLFAGLKRVDTNCMEWDNLKQITECNAHDSFSALNVGFHDSSNKEVYPKKSEIKSSLTTIKRGTQNTLARVIRKLTETFAPKKYQVSKENGQFDALNCQTSAQNTSFEQLDILEITQELSIVKLWIESQTNAETQYNYNMSAGNFKERPRIPTQNAMVVILNDWHSSTLFPMLQNVILNNAEQHAEHADLVVVHKDEGVQRAVVQHFEDFVRNDDMGGFFSINKAIALISKLISMKSSIATEIECNTLKFEIQEQEFWQNSSQIGSDVALEVLPEQNTSIETSLCASVLTDDETQAVDCIVKDMMKESTHEIDWPLEEMYLFDHKTVLSDLEISQNEQSEINNETGMTMTVTEMEFLQILGRDNKFDGSKNIQPFWTSVPLKNVTSQFSVQTNAIERESERHLASQCASIRSEHGSKITSSKLISLNDHSFDKVEIKFQPNNFIGEVQNCDNQTQDRLSRLPLDPHLPSCCKKKSTSLRLQHIKPMLRCEQNAVDVEIRPPGTFDSFSLLSERKARLFSNIKSPIELTAKQIVEDDQNNDWTTENTLTAVTEIISSREDKLGKITNFEHCEQISKASSCFDSFNDTPDNSSISRPPNFIISPGTLSSAQCPMKREQKNACSPWTIEYCHFDSSYGEHNSMKSNGKENSSILNDNLFSVIDDQSFHRREHKTSDRCGGNSLAVDLVSSDMYEVQMNAKSGLKSFYLPNDNVLHVSANMCSPITEIKSESCIPFESLFSDFDQLRKYREIHPTLCTVFMSKKSVNDDSQIRKNAKNLLLSYGQIINRDQIHSSLPQHGMSLVSTTNSDANDADAGSTDDKIITFAFPQDQETQENPGVNRLKVNDQSEDKLFHNVVEVYFDEDSAQSISCFGFVDGQSDKTSYHAPHTALSSVDADDFQWKGDETLEQEEEEENEKDTILDVKSASLEQFLHQNLQQSYPTNIKDQRGMSIPSMLELFNETIPATGSYAKIIKNRKCTPITVMPRERIIDKNEKQPIQSNRSIAEGNTNCTMLKRKVDLCNLVLPNTKPKVLRKIVHNTRWMKTFETSRKLQVLRRQFKAERKKISELSKVRNGTTTTNNNAFLKYSQNVLEVDDDDDNDDMHQIGWSSLYPKTHMQPSRGFGWLNSRKLNASSIHKNLFMRPPGNKYKQKLGRNKMQSNNTFSDPNKVGLRRRCHSQSNDSSKPPWEGRKMKRHKELVKLWTFKNDNTHPFQDRVSKEKEPFHLLKERKHFLEKINENNVKIQPEKQCSANNKSVSTNHGELKCTKLSMLGDGDRRRLYNVEKLNHSECNKSIPGMCSTDELNEENDSVSSLTDGVWLDSILPSLKINSIHREHEQCNLKSKKCPMVIECPEFNLLSTTNLEYTPEMILNYTYVLNSFSTVSVHRVWCRQSRVHGFGRVDFQQKPAAFYESTGTPVPCTRMHRFTCSYLSNAARCSSAVALQYSTSTVIEKRSFAYGLPLNEAAFLRKRSQIVVSRSDSFISQVQAIKELVNYPRVHTSLEKYRINSSFQATCFEVEHQNLYEMVVGAEITFFDIPIRSTRVHIYLNLSTKVFSSVR